MKNVVFFLQGGIGKHIASTAVVECIKNNHPDREIIVVCPYPEVFLNNPFVHRVYRSNTVQYFYNDFIKDKDTIYLGNEVYQSNEYVAQNKHIIQSWCEMFNLKYSKEQPKLYINQVEIYDVQSRFAKEKPILVIQPNGGAEGQPNNNYSWSRDIPPFFTELVIKELKEKYHIYHLCRPNQLKFDGAEQLSLPWRETFALLTLAKGRLLIDSYAQHASAALGLQSVVCWIGTKPDKLGYNLHKNILAKDSAKAFYHPIDGIVSEQEFIGLSHQCNIDLTKAFNKNEILSYF
jgi:hypothetical protein